MKVNAIRLEELARTWDALANQYRYVENFCEGSDVVEAYETCSEQLREIIKEEIILSNNEK